MSPFVLPDVLRPGLAVVFCGTAAGTESARQAAYYAHPQNRFLAGAARGGTDAAPAFARPEFATLPEHGLGLTDIAKTASGMDRELPPGALGRDACAALEAKILEFAPGVLAFTSLTAGRRFLGPAAGFGPQARGIGATAIWVLPSPSPTATWNWDLAPWRALAAARKSCIGRT